MSDFDNYLGYWSSIKYGGLVIQEPDQPVNTVEGANEAIKQGIEGDLEPGYLRQPSRSQEETDEKNRRLKVAAAMPVDIAAGAARGLAEGWVGLPGDVVSLARALYNMGAVGAGESKLDAFLEGLDLSTGLPTTEDIRKFLDENIGPIVPSTAAGETKEARESAVSGAQLVGELLAPAGYISLASRGVKAAKARRAKKNDGAQ
jgi:hypothetical protein